MLLPLTTNFALRFCCPRASSSKSSTSRFKPSASLDAPYNFCCACSFAAAASALAAAAFSHASAFLAAAAASFSIASARAALAVAVAVAAVETVSAAESEAACKHSRLQPRNRSDLSLFANNRVICSPPVGPMKEGARVAL